MYASESQKTASQSTVRSLLLSLQLLIHLPSARLSLGHPLKMAHPSPPLGSSSHALLSERGGARAYRESQKQNNVLHRPVNQQPPFHQEQGGGEVGGRLWNGAKK